MPGSRREKLNRIFGESPEDKLIIIDAENSLIRQQYSFWLINAFLEVGSVRVFLLLCSTSIFNEGVGFGDGLAVQEVFRSRRAFINTPFPLQCASLIVHSDG